MFFLFQSCKNETPTPTQSNMTENPLLAEWNTPFGVPPFDTIKSEDYVPAIREAIKRHNKEIDFIISNKEEATFKNTIEALETSGILLSKISSAFSSVGAANTDDVLKEAKKILSPEQTAHKDEIRLNETLFKRIKTVYEQRDSLKLTAEELYLLEETYKNYVRAGVNLEGEKYQQVTENDINRIANQILNESNCSTLIYAKLNN